MNRRTFLQRVGISAAAAPLAPLAATVPKADPILKALLDKGARIVERPDWVLWRGEVVLGNDVVGYITNSGVFQLCTSTWPAFR